MRNIHNSSWPAVSIQLGPHTTPIKVHSSSYFKGHKDPVKSLGGSTYISDTSLRAQWVPSQIPSKGILLFVQLKIKSSSFYNTEHEDTRTASVGINANEIHLGRYPLAFLLCTKNLGDKQWIETKFLLSKDIV